MTSRRLGQRPGFGRERERVMIEDRFEGGPTIAALAGFILALLVGVGLYAFSSGRDPTSLRAPVDETWGQSLSL